MNPIYERNAIDETSAGGEGQRKSSYAVNAIASCVSRLEQALRDDPALSGRLGLADTSVEIRVPGLSPAAFAGVLQPGRVEFSTTSLGPPEVELVMGAAEMEAFCAGQLSVQVAVMTGSAEYHGPVRKFLRILPILTGALIGSEDERACESRPREADDAFPAEPAASRMASLTSDFWSVECRDVHKSFAAQPVLSGVSLGIPEGMITVILGPSGTGKSVLLKHMIGLLFPDAGDVMVHGRSLSEMTVSELLRLRRRFGILFQDGALFGSMNLGDNVAFPLRQHTDLTEPEIAEIVNERMEDVGLAGLGNRMPNELSGGMRKRAGLARALVLQPEVILCDEPDSGLDPVRTSLLSDLIAAVHRRHGGTFVVISHDIRLAKRLGEYLAILWQGRIVEAGPREAILGSSDPFVRQFLAGDIEGPLGME